MYHAIDGVGLDVEGEHLQRVGMHVERVFLRVVDEQGAVGSPSLARLLIIPETVAQHLVLVLLVDIHHILETFADARLLVVEQAVASQFLLVVDQCAAAEEL